MDKALWMARLLFRRGPLTRTEIQEAWREEDPRGRAMAQSTFYDNCHYLEAQLGLRVVRDGHRYAVCGDEGASLPWMQRLQEGGPEPGAPDGRGSHWLPVLQEALNKGYCLRMGYAPLDKAAYETELAPYCLHQFRRNHYCVGHSSRHGEVRNFALDRMTSLVLLPRRYAVPESFDAARYFRYSFGAFGGNDMKPACVVLEADEAIAAYLRSRPLHVSQRCTRLPAGRRWRIELEVAPTDDFVAELLSFGDRLVVVSPEPLRRLLGERLRQAADAYAG